MADKVKRRTLKKRAQSNFIRLSIDYRVVPPSEPAKNKTIIGSGPSLSTVLQYVNTILILDKSHEKPLRVQYKTDCTL